MLRLHKIFFNHLLLLLVLLFVALAFVSYYGIKNIELDNFRKLLENEIILTEEIIASRGVDDDLVRQIDKKIKSRITIISEDGKVLAESRYDKKEMENHRLRPEVQEALKKGWGWSERYSSTVHQNLLYVAHRSGDRILRIAYPVDEIQKHFMRLWIQFLLIFLGLIIVTLMISYLMSQKIKQEIDGIVEYVKKLSHKEYDTLYQAKFAQEFETITKHLQRLAQNLKKRDAKKRKFTQKIKEISKQRNDLISAVSHEFKNPVAIIHGYAQSLLDEPDMPKALQQRFIQKIYQASEKISYMIDRLALAMKFESSSIELQKSRFDLCELAQEAATFLQQKYKNRECTFECGSCEIYADKALMETVVLNLLDNALKYSESDVRVVCKDGIFCVEDRGIGIKEEHQEKITKKFYRVKHSFDNSMGLGLYIVSYILDLHGVQLQIESEYKKGSRFCFEIKKLQEYS
ncbi:sensor histidine kinase [Nitratiruptor sp. SB155-2]|uniref:sensor histidine kinase n=1 Tax=Nitratiruptor sp. (strain SB155-2) TaxID=387092 RepID=UPI000158708D|nr:ATP-binding protein [Nitratiruptor sp. SB155-2]BAF70858.1 two-component sensor histidine kinase [Nitratiruptor sp. SB155-2]